MSTESPYHLDHLLQVSNESLWILILYTFFNVFPHVYSPRAGADNPLWTKFGCQQKGQHTDDGPWLHYMYKLTNEPKGSGELTRWLYLRLMRPKDAEGTANSVDPDQTVPIWICTVCPNLSVRKLRIIRVEQNWYFIMYRKNPKNLDTLNVCCNYPKIR